MKMAWNSLRNAWSTHLALMKQERRAVATAAICGGILLLFAGYLIFLPEFNLVPSYCSYNEQRLQSLLLFTMTCSLFMLCSTLREEWLRTFAVFSTTGKALLAALLALGLLSAAGAAYPLFALLEVSHFALIFLTILCLAGIRVRLGNTFDLLVTFILVAVAWHYLLKFCLIYFAVAGQGTELAMVRNALLQKFSHIRFFSQWQSWTLALMVLPLILEGRLSPLVRFFCLLPAMGWWLLFFMSGTRGTLLACAVAFPITFFLYRRRSLPWLRWQAWAVSGGLSLYLLFYALLPKIFGFAAASGLSQGFAGREFTTLTGRLKLWSIAVEMSGRHPWLGVGPMHYADDAVSYAAHPHNALLQIAAEWGLPALAIVLLLFIIGLRAWLRAAPGNPAEHEQEEGKLQPALFAALLTAAVHAMFSGIIVMPVSLTMMTLVLGWMLGITRSRADKRNSRPPALPARGHHLLLILFALAVLAGMTTPLSTQLPTLEQVHREYAERTPPEGKSQPLFPPRFWILGYLAPYYPDQAVSLPAAAADDSPLKNGLVRHRAVPPNSAGPERAKKIVKLAEVPLANR